MRVLLVEDDASIADPLAETLRLQGFDVVHVSNATAALSHAGPGPDAPDVVLLDLGLPDLDGLEVCRRIRLNSDVAIIVVSARDAELDRVMGLELGADDYVVKPFSARELVARIRAVSRRRDPSPVAAPADVVQTIGNVSIDRRARRVHVAAAEVDLTNKEFDLLAYLAEQPGAVRSRVDIMSDVWDSNWYGPTKTVDVHVAAIRRKLGDPRWIEAVRGVGFRFEVPR